MPLSLPPSLQLFKPNDADARRYLPPIERSVTQVLTYLRSTFDDAANQGLRILKPLLLKALTVDDVTVNNSATVTGPLNSSGSFNSTGPANLSGGVVTPTGFKFQLDMGYFWRSAAVAATRYRTAFLAQNDEATNYFRFPTLFQPTFAGSILGMQTWSQGSAGGTVNVQLFKNTIAITGAPLIDVTTGSAAINVSTAVSYAKGLYSFLPGDYYITSVTFNTAGNQAIQLRLFIEMAT